MAATVPLGMPSGKVGHHPGWKPLQGSAAAISQARLHARAGSPDPSEGTCTSPSGFHRRDRATSTPLRAPDMGVRGRVCGAKSQQRGKAQDSSACEGDNNFGTGSFGKRNGTTREKGTNDCGIWEDLCSGFGQPVFGIYEPGSVPRGKSELN